MTAPLPTTQELWKPLSVLQEELGQAGVQLRAAALANDIPALLEIGARMNRIQAQMAEAGQAVREHARQKVAAAQNAKPLPDDSNRQAIGEMLLHALQHQAQSVAVETEKTS